MTARIAKTPGRQRFLIAGIGGITPVLLSLVVIDLRTLLLNVTALAIATYAIRAAALFAVGGLIGWLHRNEVDPVKLFQLGIAAPALITAAINGGRVTLPQVSGPQTAQSSWGIVAPAYAEPTGESHLKRFSLPRETATQQIFRGLFGSVPKNVWFVIAGSHGTRNAAEKQARDIRARGFRAEVYAPYDGNSRYSVVIGAQMTHAAARRLRHNAIVLGLPKDTHLWTFPEK